MMFHLHFPFTELYVVLHAPSAARPMALADSERLVCLLLLCREAREVGVCVCVCGGGGGGDCVCVPVCVCFLCLCVCVCVCVRERECERACVRQ